MGSKCLQIIHLSDIHFGAGHRFDPAATPSGDQPRRTGYPTLAESLLNDWTTCFAEDEPIKEVLIAISGDITVRASADEFAQAKSFIRAISKGSAGKVKLSFDKTFIVPGNHDVTYSEPTLAYRWAPYLNLLDELCESEQSQQYKSKRVRVANHKPGELTSVLDYSDEGFIFIEINSSLEVLKGTQDEQRGQVSLEAISRINSQLKEIEKRAPKEFAECIKIAMVHHHPVLIPQFAEPGRNYDAIVNAAPLLALLDSFGFHLIVHGHKHAPHVFSYDVSCSWTQHNELPNRLLVVAGGSVGSVELPDLCKHPTNTYNIITIKWNSDTQEGRISVQTRQLVRFDHGSGRLLLPDEWFWTPVSSTDHVLRRRAYGPAKSIQDRKNMPKSSPIHSPLESHATVELSDCSPENAQPPELLATDASRVREYVRLRGKLPVIEITPSLLPGQEYQAFVWIESHDIPDDAEIFRRSECDELNSVSLDLVKVVWNGGSYFKPPTIEVENAPKFQASFAYWGSFLIEVELHFADKYVARAYTYAYLPSAQ